MLYQSSVLSYTVSFSMTSLNQNLAEPYKLKKSSNSWFCQGEEFEYGAYFVVLKDLHSRILSVKSVKEVLMRDGDLIN